ncbi:cupredoxin domain-containing protein [Candidatus Micrarchaeota archaeon]|nr:cupredoxin domain-containing protein [Candidatus Micrarchaeota archaeon]
MSEITISKTTLLVFGLLVVAGIVGGFVFLGAKSNDSGTFSGPAAPSGPSPSQPSVAGQNNIQEVYLQATPSGYDKPELTVKKGIPVRLHFSAKDAGCGSYLVLDGFNVKLLSRNGEEQIAEFTPAKEGTYAFHCSMNMFRGKMVVSS